MHPVTTRREFGAVLIVGLVKETPKLGTLAATVVPGAALLAPPLFLRTTVVPSVMLALGRANWWFPRSLDRALPRLAVEPPEAVSPAESVSPAEALTHPR